MELLVKQVIKILSFADSNCSDSHAVFAQLPSQNLLRKLGGEDKLLERLRRYSKVLVGEETATASSSNGRSPTPPQILLRLSDGLAKQTNDEKQLSLFFKEDKSNRSLYFLYRLILQAGSAGITYSELAAQFNSIHTKANGSVDKSSSKIIASTAHAAAKDLKKLDITNVSHYCRKLFALKFVNILPEKVCKIAIATKFQRDARALNILDLRVKRKAADAAAAASLADVAHDDDLKKQTMTKLTIVSDPWKFLKEDTFILKELSFTQNILLNFASYEAYAKEGLLQTEIA